MKLPSKVTDYRDSVLMRFPKVLRELDKYPLTPQALFRRTKRSFANVGEFVETLDCLFILDKIQIDEETGVIQIVKADKL